MASKKLAPAPKKASTLASAPRTAYLPCYDTKDWSNEITLLPGGKSLDGHGGALSLPYPTMNGAQDTCIKWALRQLKVHLRTYDPPLNTKEEFDAEFDAWQKSSSEQGDRWSYTVSKGDETLVVTVAKFPEEKSCTYMTQTSE